MKNVITEKLKINFPIIQAGMVYVSGAKLAAASANAGILGVIGAGSMTLELLDQQIVKAKTLTSGSLAINVPLLYSKSKEQIEIALKHGIKIFITSAGSPKTYTDWLKSQGCIVIHVTSTPELAKKCEAAGVDMVIAEGFEAGGHNGRDEITTMSLVPQVVDAVKIPVIAAGGIADGRQMAAAFCLGAQAVQIGTRFVATVESSAHENFKNELLKSHPGSTILTLKKQVPVRLLKNKFAQEILEMEARGASKEELEQHLGKGRAKSGMLEGDIDNGELEIGQVASMIHDIPTAQTLITRLWDEYKKVKLQES